MHYVCEASYVCAFTVSDSDEIWNEMWLTFAIYLFIYINCCLGLFVSLCVNNFQNSLVLSKEGFCWDLYSRGRSSPPSMDRRPSFLVIRYSFREDRTRSLQEILWCFQIVFKIRFVYLLAENKSIVSYCLKLTERSLELREAFHINQEVLFGKKNPKCPPFNPYTWEIFEF